MAKRLHTDKAVLFERAWRMLTHDSDGALLTAEYAFNAPKTKHRFDYALVAYRIAVEVEGGQFAAGGGRHNRDSDRRKYNLAASLGWRVFRFSTQALENDPWDCVKLVLLGMEA